MRALGFVQAERARNRLEDAEVHDYHDELTGVLASSLAKRAPGYTSLGFPDPRRLPRTASAPWSAEPEPVT